ncbi:hypothetical protein ACS0TY_024260 [Phlomoides rotata]
MILECGWSDIHLEGHPFTWSRGRGTNRFVEKRLDRAMGNKNLHYLFPRARLLNMLAPISDHNLILVDTHPGFTVVKSRRFQFENKWLYEPDLGTVVRRNWLGFQDCDLLHRLHVTANVLQV